MIIPAKILLFGEYAILKGGDALAIPYPRFCGELSFQVDPLQTDSNRSIAGFANYLVKNVDQLQTIKFDLEQLREDINKGLWYKSSIPIKSGLGSSGSLVAAICHVYGEAQDELPDLLINDLAYMESFFHGKSSGIDPMVSYLNRSVLLKGGVIQTPEFETKTNFIQLVRVQGEGKTGNLVDIFQRNLQDKTYRNAFRNEYIPLQNSIIKQLLEGTIQNTHENLLELSTRQLILFPDMIPPDILPLWNEGLRTKQFALKLCGSGGGGYMIRFNFSQ